MPELEERQARVEGILEQLEKGVSSVELAIVELRKEIADLRKEMSSNFRWLTGIMLTMWVTIILAILIK